VLFEATPRGGLSDLHLLDPASGRETALTRTADREERWPAWAPDGSALAFAFRGGSPGAGIALRERGARGFVRARDLASSEPPLLYLRPEFSPDARLLVAQKRRSPDDANSDLWLLERGGSSPPRALVSDPAWHQFKAAFSRDGARVIFSRRAAAGGAQSIWSVPTAGGAPQPLQLDARFDQHSARPSPTRDELAFSADRGGNGSHDLYLSDLSGGGIRALCASAEQDEYAPRWSPDGERLVAIRARRGRLPRLADPESLRDTRIAVFDRSGALLHETPGFMADWMPPWQD